ncbi:MAG TPA: polysaccharide biosynthesis/export family protein [Lacipirellulaceae bacterium]|jgi:polysaccharide export outer membrane protein|nr:polysaccharide biosynthesis/export family protein [Lacipirellulaceae bacterium]
MKRRDWVVMLGCAVGILLGVRDGLGQQACQQQPCQAVNFAAPFPIWGVDSAAGCGCSEVGWDARGMIPWQEFAQGEYVGHARTPHVPEYRIREGDLIAIYYRRTREELSRPYELQVGDRIRVESLTAGRGPSTSTAGGDAQPTDDSISRELVIQPDGTITLPLLGQVRATRRTVPQLRDELEEQYKKYFRVPSITVTPITVNTKLEDLLNTVDSRYGTVGGLQIQITVTPAGEIQLPGVASVFVQNLTLNEARQEIDARYDQEIPGVHVTLVLVQRAKRFVYVLGEVAQPGRYELDAPTDVIQALALAGRWTPGSNLRQVVVMRRGDDWRLMATMLDLRGALYARRPVPADDIWLNDSDIVLVPKTPIQQTDEFIEQYVTRGLYSLVPREVIWNLDTTGSL